MAARHAILIGNGKFPQEPALSPLEGPPQDVERLGALLADPAVGGFRVQSFVDGESHALNNALEKTLNEAEQSDLILLYYSGHGKLDRRGQLCLASANTRLDTLRSTSLVVPFLKSLIDDCRSHQILLMLDCCFSGAAGKSFGGVRSAVEDQLQVTGGAGLHILASSTAIETSLEREDAETGQVMGSFTRCVVDGIRSGDADINGDAEVTLTDLRNYLQGRLKGQSPRYWGFETAGDLTLAHAPNPKPAPLPAQILEVLGSPIADARRSMIPELVRIMRGPNARLALSAVQALHRLVEDDSKQVSRAAEEALGGAPTAREPAQPLVSSPSPLPAETEPSRPPIVGRPMAPAPPIIEAPPILEPTRVSPPPRPPAPRAAAAARVKARPPAVPTHVTEVAAWRPPVIDFLAWEAAIFLGFVVGGPLLSPYLSRMLDLYVLRREVEWGTMMAILGLAQAVVVMLRSGDRSLFKKWSLASAAAAGAGVLLGTLFLTESGYSAESAVYGLCGMFAGLLQALLFKGMRWRGARLWLFVCLVPWAGMWALDDDVYPHLLVMYLVLSGLCFAWIIHVNTRISSSRPA